MAILTKHIILTSFCIIPVNLDVFSRLRHDREPCRLPRLRLEFKYFCIIHFTNVNSQSERVVKTAQFAHVSARSRRKPFVVSVGFLTSCKWNEDVVYGIEWHWSCAFLRLPCPSAYLSFGSKSKRSSRVRERVICNFFAYSIHNRIIASQHYGEFTNGFPRSSCFGGFISVSYRYARPRQLG